MLIAPNVNGPPNKEVEKQKHTEQEMGSRSHEEFRRRSVGRGVA